MSFLDLFKKKKVVKKYGPTFWDSVDYTAIAQTEIEDKEKKGVMSEVFFKTENGEKVVIATTRPELLPACVALLYNPSDERYTFFKNQNAIIPLFEDKIPIIPDQDVEKDFGTGLVMCCTFGDIQDVEWWKRHSLPIKECIEKNGRIKNSRFLDGMKIKDAREIILNKLKEKNLLGAQEEVMQHVKCAERSGAILEIIPTHQWYITVLDYKKDLLKKASECTWYPDYMKERLKHWIEGLNQDWCISRQRYSGVQFPVWYSKKKGEEGKIIVAEVKDLPIDPQTSIPSGYMKEEVEPDVDIMDTWATSALTPQLSTHWITEEFHTDTEKHKKLFPFDLRPQAHEIIRTWAFASITKSLFHENTIPWKNLMISGWCLAEDKSKMSKSKGNVITPKDLIIKNGTDIVRYWASTSKLGMDITYSEQIFKIGNKLINKIWNASKFISMHLESIDLELEEDLRKEVANKKITASLDLWILSSLYNIVKKATESFMVFEYSEAKNITEKFFWNDFCDNYLELVKTRVYNKENTDKAGSLSAAITMHYCLRTLLRLFAPFIPHITEEINNIIFGPCDSIHKRGSWPKLNHYIYKNEAYEDGRNTLILLELIRKYKSLNHLSLKTLIEEIHFSGAIISSSALTDLKNAANCKSIKHVDNINEKNVIASDCGNFKLLIKKLS